VVPSTRALPDDAALAELAAGRLDPRRVAIVPPGAAASPGATASPGAAGELRPARTEKLSEEHLRVHLPGGAAGWLVLANAYAPQWKAEVDGRSAEVSPTNYAAMGLPVSASARTVDFSLDRSGFWAGAALSIAALLVMAGLALWPRLRPPPAP
jgi:hypothetical protein